MSSVTGTMLSITSTRIKAVDAPAEYTSVIPLIVVLKVRADVSPVASQVTCTTLVFAVKDVKDVASPLTKPAAVDVSQLLVVMPPIENLS